MPTVSRFAPMMPMVLPLGYVFTFLVSAFLSNPLSRGAFCLAALATICAPAVMPLRHPFLMARGGSSVSSRLNARSPVRSMRAVLATAHLDALKLKLGVLVVRHDAL